MKPRSMVAVWLKETRADFLVLSVALVSIGGTAAMRSGSFHLPSFALTMLGVMLAHAGVNLFNEYSDWRTGIDSLTVRTPFSGGSGMMQGGFVEPRKVFFAAWGVLGAAFLAGIALAAKAGLPVLALMAVGGATAVFYSDRLARWTVGEAASGLTLGTLVVLGTYYVQTGSFGGPILWVSVPPGILTAMLLFLNEFPDADADRAGGRRHLVIVLGTRRAAVLYAILAAAVYAAIAAGPALAGAPRGILLGLLTLPLSAAAVRIALAHHDDRDRLLPALGLNVAVVLATDFLLAVGFLFG